MPILKHKVFAYITHGDRLLLFTHPNAPEAGIQVPAGTLEDGEEPEAGVLREATEETGLTTLEIVSFLGEQRRAMADVGKDEIHHRYFFHLRCLEEPPNRWHHGETHPSDGGPPIPFDFFWARLPSEVPELVADHGYHLPALLTSLPGFESAEPTLEDSIAFAATVHRGQVYPSPRGEPFILHPLRVMLQLESDTDRIVAVLHDAIEDTDATLGDLQRLGYSGAIVGAVDCLTRRDGETYDAYIGRVEGHAIARRVKLADLADNLANNQCLEPTAETRARIARYEKARARLTRWREDRPEC